MEKPTQKMKFEMGKMISAHCLANDVGNAVYEKGWDDRRIAEEFKVAPATVKYLRKELIGPLFKSTKGPPGTSVKSRLDRIEDYLTSKNANWKTSR